MDTILVFSTSIGRANADMLAGVREFAKDAKWNVQSFVYDGEPFPLRKLLDFWTPAGCIVETCGTACRPKSSTKRRSGALRSYIWVANRR